jgi:hypothetical protein
VWIIFGQLPTSTQKHGKKGLKEDLVSLYVLLEIFHVQFFLLKTLSFVNM